MLNTYQEFINKVEELGIIALSGNFLEGFPTLQTLTEDAQWHTGNPETDPWQWKDRIAMDKKAAFGCVLGGKKGFISKALYPWFYTACHPERSLEERYDNGVLPKTVLDVFQLFNSRNQLSTADIRAEFGGNKSALDKAIVNLQKEFFLTVCGNQRKISKSGEEYGWPANTYCKVKDWAADWLHNTEFLKKEESQRKILDHCQTWQLGIDLKKLAKLLFSQVD